jgi:hypothetical protein
MTSDQARKLLDDAQRRNRAAETERQRRVAAERAAAAAYRVQVDRQARDAQRRERECRG